MMSHPPGSAMSSGDPRMTGLPCTVEDALKPAFRRSWQEAVAIVQEVASRLGDLPSVPPPDDLIIEEDGTIALGFASEVLENPVTSLASLLVRLLDATDAPAQLRRLAQEDAGPNPPHASLAELTSALAFFDQPDRRGELRSLAARMRSVPHTAAVKTERPHTGTSGSVVDFPRQAAIPLEAQPVAEAETETELERLRRRVSGVSSLPLEQKRIVALGRAIREPTHGQIAFISAVLAVCAVGTFAGLRGIKQGPAGSATAARVAESSDGQSMAVGAGQTPTRADMVLPVMTGVAPQPRSVRSEPGRPARRASPLLSITGIAAGKVAIVSERWEPLEPVEIGLAPDPEVDVPGAAIPRDSMDERNYMAGRAAIPADAGHSHGVPRRSDIARSSTSRNNNRSPAESLPPRVYSVAEPEVQPARLLRTQLPKEPAAGVDTGYFDLIVNESGDVELVRLFSPAHRYEDRMLVAAAKAWKFAPALLHGEPVKYRLRIPIILPDAP
jgi:hypothetical protein